MAGALRRRAATAVDSTIRASFPTIRASVPAAGSIRNVAGFAATKAGTTFRLSSAVKSTIRASVPAAGSIRNVATPRIATKATTISSASIPAIKSTIRPSVPAAGSIRNLATFRLATTTATIRAPASISVPFRCTHTAAIPEAVEARIAEVESKLVSIQLALTDAIPEAVEARIAELEGKLVLIQLELKKDLLDARKDFIDAQSTLNVRVTTQGHHILAEGRRNVTRAANSSAENVRAVMEVGKVAWRVVITVVGASASTAFAVVQLIRADGETHHEAVATDLIKSKTAELQTEFTAKLEATVERAVQLALAKEARRSSQSADDAIRAFQDRLNDMIQGLDDKIDKAVDVAVAKHQMKPKTDPKGK